MALSGRLESWSLSQSLKALWSALPGLLGAMEGGGSEHLCQSSWDREWYKARHQQWLGGRSERKFQIRVKALDLEEQKHRWAVWAADLVGSVWSKRREQDGSPLVPLS